jgi:hypothetical protein
VVVEEFGKVNIVVNAAVITYQGPMLKLALICRTSGPLKLKKV